MLFEGSRYSLSKFMVSPSTGRMELGPRERFLFTEVEGILPHCVRDGDTLWSIAATYYGSDLEDETNYWWVIAEFQPTPILDPTVKLEVGSIIFVPPLPWIQSGLAGGSNEDLSAL